MPDAAPNSLRRSGRSVRRHNGVFDRSFQLKGHIELKLSLLLLLLFSGLGCNSSKPEAVDLGSSPVQAVVPQVDPCLTPNDGCACSNPGQVIACGVVRQSGDYKTCSMGERTCGADRVWGPCVGDRIVDWPPAQKRLSALGTATPCAANPCDPQCQGVQDDSGGLALPPGLVDDNGITLVPGMGSGGGMVDPMTCTGLTVSPASQTITVSQIRNTTGVLGEYFNTYSTAVNPIPSTWAVAATRIEPNIDFNWVEDLPGVPAVLGDGFSVRWTGTITPPTTGNYTFYTQTNDGVRFWLDGNLLINKWVNQDTEWSTSAQALTAGVSYPFKMEYFEASTTARAHLKWQGPGIAKQVIPAQYFTGLDGAGATFASSPANLTFAATVDPPGCYGGALTPAWSVDAVDISTINSMGELSVYSPLAKTINVSAYAGPWSGQATANVVVDALDTRDAPAGSVGQFAMAASIADVITWLYPYNNVMLPLGMQPPLIMYDKGGVSASAVKLSLTFPATGTPSFKWEKIYAEPTNPLLRIPLEAWQAFERAAKASTGKLSLQRVVAGVPRNPVDRVVNFALGPAQGRIYYTQYSKGDFPVGAMVADPSSPSMATSAFPVTGDDGCPVCHSMSAQGNKFVSSDRAWVGKYGGISRTLASGMLEPLSDWPTPVSATYTTGSEYWGGFTWAALTPDGQYVLAANNLWGNTKADADEHNDSDPAAFDSGGNGRGLLGEYYPSTNFTGNRWMRTDPKVFFNWGTGNPGWNTTSDAFSVRWTGLVQGRFKETYTFSIRTRDGVRLWIDGNLIIDQIGYQGALTTFTGMAALDPAVKSTIRLDYVESTGSAEIELRWQSPRTPLANIPPSQLYDNLGQRGLHTKYYSNNSFTEPFTFDRLEMSMAQNWGTAAPRLDMPVDDFSMVATGFVEGPVTGNVQFCIDSTSGSDDRTELIVNGTTLFNTAGGVNSCAATTIAMVAGQKYPITLRHREFTSSAKAVLSWQLTGTFTRRTIEPEYFTPPNDYVAPTNGLTATIYDTIDFNQNTAVGATVTSTQRIETTDMVYRDWGAARPEFGLLTSSETWSARYTGRLVPPCSGIYEFQGTVNDSLRLWIGRHRLLRITSTGTATDALYLEGGVPYDFKADHTDNTGNASVYLTWKPHCQGAAAFSPIPASAFLPTGDSNTAGFVLTESVSAVGREGANGVGYFIWETPNAVGAPPIDVTSLTPGNWGLGKTAMMMPSFAPDGSKLAFIDGDQSGGASWRQGLSVFSFDQAGRRFWDRRLVASSFPNAGVMKWPAFESDSRSIVYQLSALGDPGNFGGVVPTEYAQAVGRLFSVDSASVDPQPVELLNANQGERALDRNKAYQATVLPTATAGYRWVVFTSIRPFGNLFNITGQEDYSNPDSYTKILDPDPIQSMLWVAALEDTPSGGVDRSWPAFFLPNQTYHTSGADGLINERGYWVLEPCKTAGNTAASLCEVNEDCCAGNVCQIDVPVSQPVVRHCQVAPDPLMCQAAGSVCAATGDCCNGLVCINSVCEPPPTVEAEAQGFAPANFTRTYEGTCAQGLLPVWRFFDWKADIPMGTSIEVWAQTAAIETDLATLDPAPSAVNTPDAVLVAVITDSSAVFTGTDVGAALAASGYQSSRYLKITLRFVPDGSGMAAPKLTEWRQQYSCVAGE